MPSATVFAVPLGFVCVFLLMLLQLSCFPDFFNILSSLISFVSYNIAFCAPCDSNLLAQYTTFHLLFHYFLCYSSLNVSVIISSSWISFINCSFNLLLSFTLYLHWFAFTLRGPIHSSALPLSSLPNLQYCSKSIVSLCWGLIFSFTTSSSPALISCNFLAPCHLRFA